MKISSLSPIPFALLLILLMLPNVFLWYLGEQPQEVFILTPLLFLSMAACLKKVRRLWFLLPFIALLPLYLFYITQYRTFLNENIIAVIAETNWEEAWGYIGYVSIWAMIFAVVWLGGWVWLCKKLWRSEWTWQHPSRYWVMAAMVVYLGYYYTIAQIEGKHDGTFFQTQKEKYDELQKQQSNFLVANHNLMVSDIQSNYPLGLFISLHRWYDDWQTINEFVGKMADFRFQAASQSPNKKEIVVLVIGETARRANWQLHGYTRPTNPLLSKQSNLVAFDKMQSLADITRISVPMMLTRKPPEQVYVFTFPEKSVISAFKEAGFRTYWLSNQQQYGIHDNSISVYAKEADESIYVNLAGYKYDNNYDGRLLPKLEQVLAEPHDKKFIVIHTLGSHAPYGHRYPKEEAVFLPDVHGLTKYSVRDEHHKQELLNAFDNTIVYTDKFLNNMIEQLKQQNQPTFLLYSSDHGEDLMADGCGFSGHSNKSPMNYEVATFAWYSDAYKQIFPQKIAQLNDNRHKSMNHSVIFATLLDAVDISVGNGKLSGSLFQTFDDMPPKTFPQHQCELKKINIGKF